MDSQYDLPADWGDAKPVTSRELRYVHSAVSVNQDLLIAIGSLVISAIYAATGQLGGSYAFLVLAVGVMSHVRGKQTDGFNRYMWDIVKDYDKPPLDEIEPDWNETKTKRGDELLNE